jgi:hypothetical protein
MDLGANSGWVYAVNGSGYSSMGSGDYPTVAASETTINENEYVLWRYTEDWTKDSYISGPVTKTKDTGSVLSPAVTASGGEAAVSVGAADITNTIKSAKEGSASEIVIRPEITGSVTKVTVDLPKASLSSIADETDSDLTIETPVGNMSIPNDVLSAIAGQASGNTVTVSLNTMEASSLTAAQRSAAAGSAVYDISIFCGDSRISSFGGGSITVSLPYTLKAGEDPNRVMVWYLNDSGELKQMTSTYDKTTCMVRFTTTHLSYYVVGYQTVSAPADWKNTFTDIKSGDWFYDAVKYVSQNKLMSGISDTSFAPNENMTRSMLVTVLYRLAGSPAVKGTGTFKDVPGGKWYTGAVEWARENNIVTGYGNGRFGINDIATREQLAAILYRYTMLSGLNAVDPDKTVDADKTVDPGKTADAVKSADLKAFADSGEISGWAQTAVKWAAGEGILTGLTDKTLAPGGKATRAQVAAILQRLTQNKAAK